jgi:acyl-CoA thioesterase I
VRRAALSARNPRGGDSRRSWLAAIWGTVVAATVGCTRSAKTVPKANQGARMLALGDSYTIGEGVAEEQRWPMQLAEALRKRGRKVAEPQIIARTGWTTTELEGALARENPAGAFDLVTLLIGVNDQFRGGDAETYRAPFRRMLEKAIALAGSDPKRVLVVSIPDWGATPFGARAEPEQIGAAIDQFNRVNREEAARAGAGYVDITDISREAKVNPSLLAADGLHPSGGMYFLWVARMLPEVEARLKL